MTPTISNAKLRVFLITGKKYTLTIGELTKFLHSRNVLFLLCLTPFLAVSADPALFPNVPTPSTRFFYWSCCVLLYAVFSPYWVFGVFSLWSKFTTRPIPHPVSSVPLITLLTFLAHFLPALPDSFLPARETTQYLRGYLVNIGLGLGLETIGMLWLFPLYRAENIKPSKTEFVVLNAKSIPVSSIQLVECSAHYLLVTTDLGTQKYRARMKDFLEQVTPDHGIQSHRSFWVSESEVVELSGRSIRMRSGRSIPISKSRIADVKAWMQIYGKQH